MFRGAWGFGANVAPGFWLPGPQVPVPQQHSQNSAQKHPKPQTLNPRPYFPHLLSDLLLVQLILSRITKSPKQENDTSTMHKSTTEEAHQAQDPARVMAACRSSSVRFRVLSTYCANVTCKTPVQAGTPKPTLGCRVAGLSDCRTAGFGCVLGPEPQGLL